MSSQFDKVTQAVISMMTESNGEKWQKTWKSLSHVSAAGRYYNGINVWWLSWVKMCKGYEHPIWGTYKQLESIGMQVRKGEKGTGVTYWTMIAPKDAKQGEVKPEDKAKRLIPVLREYIVFNVAQCEENLVVLDRLVKFIGRSVNPDEQMPAVDAFVAACGVPVVKGDPAYSQTRHRISMPEFKAFHSGADYYGTMFHELIHSTIGEAGRAKHKFWGDATYAMEELVAELGAAMLCNHFGIDAEPRKDHVLYIKSWVKMMEDSNRAIFTAAKKAQEAVDILLARAGEIPA